MPLYANIDGIQKAQENNLRRIAVMQPGGKAEEAVRDAVVALHRYAVSITHVARYDRWGVQGKAIGGSLRASHRIELDDHLGGMIYIDPSSVNPLGQRPSKYGLYEHARGGEHAFYDRTVSEYGPTVSSRTRTRITQAVLYGK